jgi:hypothetical protein
MEITGEGLVLGAGTTLTKMGSDSTLSLGGVLMKRFIFKLPPAA